jgi:RNA polymerase sigma-70 factor (ECF subfamily)
MIKSLPELFADLRAGRDARRTQEEIYRIASARLLEPLRGKVPLRARSRMDAEDVLHEAFLRALKNLPRAHCETERELLAWIYRVARNLMTDQAKRMSARAVPFARGTTGDAAGSVPRESRIPGHESSPETALQRREVIENVLSQLRDPEAEVIRRRWLEGQNFAEIAAALRRTPKAAKGLYTRGWKKFQALARRMEA